MAIKFQYNKTSLQQLRKELKVRVNALPTLVAKETALRLEVKKAREAAAALEKEGAKIMLLDFTPVEVSSTELRKKLKDGEDAPELISPETRAVIDRKGLYR